MRLALFALFWVVAIGAFGVWLVASGRWTPAQPDRSRYPLLGVDVLRYQGEIDWPALADAGVRFAYIKATEGGDWTDPYFARNWREAEAAGVTRGAYHFFTFCRPAEEQAAHALRTIPRESGTLPLAVDVEYGGNCKQHAGEDAIREELDRFIEIVTDSLGRPPSIYAVFESYDDFVRGRYPESPIWIQNVVVEPDLEGRREWAFWQWSTTGSPPGVEGPVDLNVFQGDEAAFRAFAGPSAPSADSLARQSIGVLGTVAAP